jgi:hypothetical protein
VAYPLRLAKLAVARAKGARHASIRLVACTFDPVQRAEFLAMTARVGATIMAIYGAGTPAKSKADIEALAACRTCASSSFPPANSRSMRNFRTSSPVL